MKDSMKIKLIKKKKLEGDIMSNGVYEEPEKEGKLRVRKKKNKPMKIIIKDA